MQRLPSAAVPAGVPHRALQSLQLLVYEYDAFGVELRTLPAGSRFQPWQPWREDRVPITLGDAATSFEWSAASPTGYFLWRDDFVERCARADAADPRAVPRTTEWPVASPFAVLDAIGARLRSAATNAEGRAMVEEALARLATIEAEHAQAAEMQRGAEGFDNTDAARQHAVTQARLLAEAQRILASARGRLGAKQL